MTSLTPILRALIFNLPSLWDNQKERLWGLGRDLGGDVDGRAGVDVGTVQSLLRRGNSWSLASAFPVHLGGKKQRQGLGLGWGCGGG